MSTLVEDLQSYQARRRFPNWQPKAPNVSYQGNRRTPEYHVLLRCLDFLPLELQVAEWDEEAATDEDNLAEHSYRETASENTAIANILRKNAADETKHDDVLYMLTKYLGKTGQTDEAIALCERWQALDIHPLVAMYALEIGVFYSILPSLIKFGDIYCKTVAQWISDDEVVHVNTGLRLMKALDLKLTFGCLQLVRDTNLYIFAPLGLEEADKRARRAVQRTMSGKDEEMLKESLPATTDFFGQFTKQSIVY